MSRKPRQPIVTAAELDAILNAPKGPSAPKSKWVDAVTTAWDTDLSNYDVLHLATEAPDGPLAAIAELVGALEIRHAGSDRVTQAMLAAILHYHLPNAIEVAQGA